MSDAAAAEHPGWRIRGLRLPGLGEDWRWIVVLGAATAAEFVWWAVSWSAGAAPAPFLGTYLLLALAGLGAALAIRSALRPVRRSGWLSVGIGTLLVGVGGSLFLPLKCAIPRTVPFWLDRPLATAEQALLGTDPWLVLDRLLGWATLPLDRLYGLWLPVQTVALFLVMLEPPSREKSRALVAYSLAWFVLGVAAATLLSSAGPIFYDRLFGRSGFAPLTSTLDARGAWITLAESERMVASLGTAHPGLVAGISAMPSMHVAISLWIWLAARRLAPRAAAAAFVYAMVIAIGSVQLGWHYVSDGVIGAFGMVAIWWLAGVVAPAASRGQVA